MDVHAKYKSSMLQLKITSSNVIAFAAVLLKDNGYFYILYSTGFK